MTNIFIGLHSAMIFLFNGVAYMPSIKGTCLVSMETAKSQCDFSLQVVFNR